VQYSPISIEGLRAITDSPKLAAIVVYYPPLLGQYAEISPEIKQKHPHLLGLDFDPSAVPK
jgi:hypothetical protein